MNIKQIVEERLRKDGYDGLCCDGCWCRVDDLFPCGCGDGLDCVPGHIKWGTFDGEQTWRIYAPLPVRCEQHAEDPSEKDNHEPSSNPLQLPVRWYKRAADPREKDAARCGADGFRDERRRDQMESIDAWADRRNGGQP